MNDPALYEAVLTAFSGEDILERAKAAYDADDRPLFMRIAHEAKGSCGNAGLDEASKAAGELVALLRDPLCTDDELKARYERFRVAYFDARETVRAALCP